jgi:hypothetical protein
MTLRPEKNKINNPDQNSGAACIDPMIKVIVWGLLLVFVLANILGVIFGHYGVSS